MDTVFDWLKQLDHTWPAVYGIIVVLFMAIEGTLLGLLADFVIHRTGIKFGEYTDNHT